MGRMERRPRRGGVPDDVAFAMVSPGWTATNGRGQVVFLSKQASEVAVTAARGGLGVGVWVAFER